MAQHTFFAISTGPAGKDCLTLGAVRALERCGTIFYPTTGGGRHAAFDCAREAVEVSGKTCVALRFSMTADEEQTGREYGEARARVREALSRGDAAFVALGDVSVYSTAARLGKALQKDGVPVRFVPGVTSFCAAACACALDLAEADEGIRIIPGDALFAAGKVAAALDEDGAKIFMKSPRHLKEIIGIAAEKHLLERAHLVQNAGREDERIFSGSALARLPDEVFRGAYLSVLIVS